jgi:SSS family solute:Na+ symporter
LGLAAVVSAEVSTADAILFMLATSLSQDLYRRFLRPAATDHDVLLVSRYAAVAGGVLGVLLALVASSVIGVLKIFYSLLGVCLFVPIVGGLYVRRVGSMEAMAAIVAGTCTLLAVHLGTGGRGFGLFSPDLCGLLASLVGAGLALAYRSFGSRSSA